MSILRRRPLRPCGVRRLARDVRSPPTASVARSTQPRGSWRSRGPTSRPRWPSRSTAAHSPLVVDGVVVTAAELCCRCSTTSTSPRSAIHTHPGPPPPRLRHPDAGPRRGRRARGRAHEAADRDRLSVRRSCGRRRTARRGLPDLLGASSSASPTSSASSTCRSTTRSWPGSRHRRRRTTRRTRFAPSSGRCRRSLAEQFAELDAALSHRRADGRDRARAGRGRRSTQVRETEDTLMQRQGRTRYTTVGARRRWRPSRLHRPADEPARIPGAVFQWGTLVRREHRGTGWGWRSRSRT